MNAVPPIAWLLLGCAVTAWIARISVEGLESGAPALLRLPYMGMALVSCTATALAYFVIRNQGVMGVPAVITAFLVGQLALAGWIDRQTTWVPDTVLLIVLVMSAAYVFSATLDATSVLRAAGRFAAPALFENLVARPLLGLISLSVAVGVGIWLVSLALWFLQTRFGDGVLTPPDMVALFLPLFVLGVTAEAGLVYMIAVFLALIMQRSDFVRSVFSNEEAVLDGKRHLGLDEDRPAVAVLSLMFAILSVVIVALVPLRRSFASLLS